MLATGLAKAELETGRFPQVIEILLKLASIHAGALEEPQFVKMGVPAVGLAVVDLGRNDPALYAKAGLELTIGPVFAHPTQGILDKGEGIGQAILTAMRDGEGRHQHLTTLGETLPHSLLDLVGAALGNLRGAYRTQPGKGASLQPDKVTR